MKNKKQILIELGTANGLISTIGYRFLSHASDLAAAKKAQIVLDRLFAEIAAMPDEAPIPKQEGAQ